MKESGILCEEGIIRVEKIIKKKNDYLVIFSDGYELNLDEDTIVSYNLYKDKEIDKITLDEIKESSNYTFAYSKALNYISTSFKSEKSVRDYLEKKEYTHDCIDYVINKLKEYKFINDEAYALEYINYLIGHGYGELLIKKKLYERGLNKDGYIEKSDEYFLNLKKVYQSKYNQTKDKIKTKRYLLSRGYLISDINKIEDNND